MAPLGSTGSPIRHQHTPTQGPPPVLLGRTHRQCTRWGSTPTLADAIADLPNLSIRADRVGLIRLVLDVEENRPVSQQAFLAITLAEVGRALDPCDFAIGELTRRGNGHLRLHQETADAYLWAVRRRLRRRWLGGGDLRSVDRIAFEDVAQLLNLDPIVQVRLSLLGYGT